MHTSNDQCHRALSVPLLVCLVFVALAGLHPAQATSGTAFFVATNGNDTNPGTQQQPWRTIQHAVDTANPGDIIYLRAGLYTESVHFHRSGLEGSPITLTNFSAEPVTIDGQANPAIFDQDGTQYWTIQGLSLVSRAEYTLLLDAWGCDGTCRGTHHWTISNNTFLGPVSIYGSYNLFESNTVDGSQHTGAENGVWELYDASHHNIFRNNEIHHFYSRGIWSMHRTHDDIFEYNYIHHIGSGSQGMCIDTDGFGTVEWRHIIRGNLLHNCGLAAIELENTFDAIVENNTIHDPGRIGINVVNYGPGLGPGADWCQAGGENNQYGDTNGDNSCEGDLTGNIIRQNLIYNGATEGAIAIHHAGGVHLWSNTIASVSSYGIILHGGAALSPQIDIQNNILAATGGPAVSVEDPASLTQDHHNLLYRTNTEDVYELRSTRTAYSLTEYQAATGRGQNSLQADPQFVDPAGGNIHLRNASPAIDAGVNTGLTEDLDGNPRPQGAEHDIGVYESLAVVPTATPVPSPTPIPFRTLTLTPTQINIHRDSAEEGSSILSVVWDLVVRVFEWLVNVAAIAISNARRILAR